MEKICRCKNKDFVTISSVFLKDKSLSLKSKGLLALVMALPDDWDFTIKGICSITKEGAGAVYSAIEELKHGGYCEVVGVKGADGRFLGYEYTFLEIPRSCVVDERQKTIDFGVTCTNSTDEAAGAVSTGVSIDYNSILDCWNKHNGKAWGRVLRLTDMRRNAIQRILKTNKITEVELMRLFKSLPFADKWLFNPNKEHETWKPDFDWWVKNTGGWLTKALEGRVHQENKKVFDDIMSGKEYSEYHPFCDGFLSWNDYYNCYLYIGGFYDGKIYDGYNDEDRPDGATVMLNNARGTLRWNSQTKTWDKI